MAHLSLRTSALAILAAALPLLGCDPPQPTLPSPSAACPAFVNGTAAFNMLGSPQAVRLSFDPEAAVAKDGPLLIFFNSSEVFSHLNAKVHLGDVDFATLMAMGGIVAEPLLPYDAARSVSDAQLGSLLDEVTACAHAQLGIDARRVHAAGWYTGAGSAARGGMLRPSYVASLALSRGASDYAVPAGNYRPPVLLTYHIWSSPEADAASFMNARTYYDSAIANGHYALMCAAYTAGETSMKAALTFLLDHPYGTPSPYARTFPALPWGTKPYPAMSGLPSVFSQPDYLCPWWMVEG